jgi:nitrate/nitrite transporter NarK
MTAEPASLRGIRLSIRDPVTVLTNTDSASLTGLGAFPRMAPYMARAASGPLTDQLGGRRVGVLCDAVSLVPVGLAPARTRLGTHPGTPPVGVARGTRAV